MAGHDHETLNLCDLVIGSYGQQLPGDGLDEVIEAMRSADVIVMGSPIYWHNICGAIRNVLDRFYGHVETGELSGRKLAFVFQGCRTREVDARGRRLHHESLCRPVRHGVRGHGNHAQRGG